MFVFTIAIVALATLIYFTLLIIRVSLFLITRFLRIVIKKLIRKLRKDRQHLQYYKGKLGEVQTSIGEAENREDKHELHKELEELARLRNKLIKYIAFARLKLVTLQTITMVLAFVRMTANMLSKVLVAVTGLSTVTLSIVAMAALITVTVVPGVLDHEFGKNNTSTGSGRYYNHTPIQVYDIDWSQDFSKMYAEVEKTDGKAARDWVEFTVLGLAVGQQVSKETYDDGDPYITYPGFINGIKGIESGSAIPDLGKTPITKQLLNAKTYRSDGTDTGALQMDTHHEAYNPAYTDYQDVLRQSKNGLPAYMPDAMYGLYRKFSGYAYDWGPKNDVRFGANHRMLVKAFDTMGIEMTDQKASAVRTVVSVSSIYNSSHLHLLSSYTSGRNPITEAASHDLIYVNIMMTIQFMEMYGYGPTDASLRLGRSIQKKQDGHPYALEKHKLARAVYGRTGPEEYGAYPNNLDKETDFGVVTPDGAEVKGALFWYLTDNMPPEAKSAVLTSVGVRTYLSNYWTDGRQMAHWRPRYDIVVALIAAHDTMAVYDLAKTMGY